MGLHAEAVHQCGQQLSGPAIRVGHGKDLVPLPHLIDDRSGVGVQVTIADVNRDGKSDILTASKLGSFVFLNRRSVIGDEIERAGRGTRPADP